MYKWIGGLLVVVLLTINSGCKSIQSIGQSAKQVELKVPNHFGFNDTVVSSSSQELLRNQFFTDTYLVALIDSALAHNQELNIYGQEILQAESEVLAKKGEILPTAGLQLGAGMDKAGKYTLNGAVESQLEVEPGRHFPHPVGDFRVGGYFSWEVDIWKKLRNAKSAANYRFLASVEGRNFLTTQIVSDIASAYYELIALDDQLKIIDKNVVLQQNVLGLIKQQKEAGRVSQLAINRSEAQVLNTQNLRFEVLQQIQERENEINFLVGRFPKKVERYSDGIDNIQFPFLSAGVPIDLLSRRTDIRNAELELEASKLDVKVMRSQFFPDLHIGANVGMNAFSPRVWFNPQSLLYNMLGDFMLPLINRKQLKADYKMATAQQNKAVYKYEQTLLKAFIEVTNQLAGISNYSASYQVKGRETQLLNESIQIAASLYNSARIDYVEVLLTQQETIESSIELIEIKKKQLNRQIDLYRSLGGGWR